MKIFKMRMLLLIGSFWVMLIEASVSNRSWVSNRVRTVFKPIFLQKGSLRKKIAPTRCPKKCMILSFYKNFELYEIFDKQTNDFIEAFDVFAACYYAALYMHTVLDMYLTYGDISQQKKIKNSINYKNFLATITIDQHIIEDLGKEEFIFDDDKKIYAWYTTLRQLFAQITGEYTKLMVCACKNSTAHKNRFSLEFLNNFFVKIFTNLKELLKILNIKQEIELLENNLLDNPRINSVTGLLDFFNDFLKFHVIKFYMKQHHNDFITPISTVYDITYVVGTTPLVKACAVDIKDIIQKTFTLFSKKNLDNVISHIKSPHTGVELQELFRHIYSLVFSMLEFIDASKDFIDDGNVTVKAIQYGILFYTNVVENMLQRLSTENFAGSASARLEVLEILEIIFNNGDLQKYYSVYFNEVIHNKIKRLERMIKEELYPALTVDAA